MPAPLAPILTLQLPAIFPEAGKSTGEKCPAPAAVAQLFLALQVPPGSFKEHTWGGHSATALALAAAAALQAY